MIIRREAFEEFINKITFKNFGDAFEKKYGANILETFPNCEKFWQVFVTPMTNRMSGYPSNPINDIDPRESISPEVEKIANFHYSMFINFVYAFDHLNHKYLSSLEDIYIHLGSVCDLVEAVIENWYFLMLKNQGKKPDLFEGISKEDFLVKADEWYQENYSSIYDHYHKRGKFFPIKVVSGKDLVIEYLGKDSQVRLDYVRMAQKIRTFRNVVVHNVKIGKIEFDGKLYIPRPSMIHKYRDWGEIRKILGDVKIINRDFEEQYRQAEQDIINLSQSINDVWEIIIDDFLREFYSPENGYLRSLYNIDFNSGPMVIAPAKPEVHTSQQPRTLASGSYSGGTAIWNGEDEDH